MILALVLLCMLVMSSEGFVSPRFSPRSPITPRSGSRRLGLGLSMSRAVYELVLVRHGESTWNEENKFTGWYDCPLSVKGLTEAKQAGQLLAQNDYKFDVAYTSMLKRAIKTLWCTLEETDCMCIPINNGWELNERCYGALQGLDKKATVEKYGLEQVNVWRRSYDIPPPDCDEDSSHCPGNDSKYAGLPSAQKIRGESLATTLARVLPYWDASIAPSIKSGKRVVVAAHGNSLRALVKHLDGIDEAAIAGLNIPTGVPLVYALDADLKPVPHKDAIAPLTGRYLGDQEQIKARIEGVKNQTGGGAN